MKLQDLKKQLPYRWRVQSVNEFNAVCVAYIDSRDVQDLLDEVLGAENWQCDYKEVKENVYCGVGIKIDDEWVWKWDCGIESKTEAEKGEASDSFKRAAVKWGVGRFLYSLEIKKLKTGEYKQKYYPVNEITGKLIFSGDDLTEYLNKPKNGTTAYNHKKLETLALPLITNKQFKQACERIAAGEKEIYYKVLADFSLEEKQKELLKQTYDSLKTQTA